MGGVAFPGVDDILGLRPAKARGAVPGQGQAGLLAGQLEALAGPERPVGIGLVFQQHALFGQYLYQGGVTAVPGRHPERGAEGAFVELQVDCDGGVIGDVDVGAVGTEDPRSCAPQPGQHRSGRPTGRCTWR